MTPLSRGGVLSRFKSALREGRMGFPGLPPGVPPLPPHPPLGGLDTVYSYFLGVMFNEVINSAPILIYLGPLDKFI